MERPSPGETDYNPNFVLPKRDVITEENWPEFAARGFEATHPSYDPEHPAALDGARALFGIEHVYTGDAYDEEQGRPRRDLPGKGIYVSPEGMLNFVKHARRSTDQPAGPEST